MRITGTLMVERWELRKLRVRGSQIAVLIHSQRAQTVRLGFIDRNDFAFTYIGNRVGAFQDFEERTRRVIHLEIVPDTQRVPNRNILCSQAIDRNSSRLSFPDVAQLIQESHHVEEPN